MWFVVCNVSFWFQIFLVVWSKKYVIETYIQPSFCEWSVLAITKTSLQTYIWVTCLSFLVILLLFLYFVYCNIHIIFWGSSSTSFWLPRILPVYGFFICHWCSMLFLFLFILSIFLLFFPFQATCQCPHPEGTPFRTKLREGEAKEKIFLFIWFLLDHYLIVVCFWCMFLCSRLSYTLTDFNFVAAIYGTCRAFRKCVVYFWWWVSLYFLVYLHIFCV